eukprot:216930-Pyramimonas_sp.AAC.1
MAPSAKVHKKYTKRIGGEAGESPAAGGWKGRGEASVKCRLIQVPYEAPVYNVGLLKDRAGFTPRVR